MPGSSEVTWKNAAWLYQTSSPVFGCLRTAGRICRVRSRPSPFQSVSMPFLWQYSSTSSRLPVWKTSCQGRPMPSL
jgi:hypothetical protein